MAPSNLRISASAIIKVPAAVLYAIIADYRNGHPRILPDTFRNLEVERGGVGDGTLITFEMRIFGSTHRLRAAVTEPEPGRVLVESYPDTGSVTTFMVDPGPASGESTVTVTTDMPISRGLRGMVERTLLPGRLHRVYDAELKKLAALAEGGFRIERGL